MCILQNYNRRVEKHFHIHLNKNLNSGRFQPNYGNTHTVFYDPNSCHLSEIPSIWSNGMAVMSLTTYMCTVQICWADNCVSYYMLASWLRVANTWKHSWAQLDNTTTRGSNARVDATHSAT